MTVDDVKSLAGAISREIGRAVTGQKDTIDLLLVALFAGGHILLEGPPGTAKTLIARCFAKTLALDYARIQFTPDLMPGDIIGANLFNFQTNSFVLTQGPIFCELLLADEINRTPPKTQAALLEAMQERSVTFDGTTHPLSPRFMVVATQNPIEQQGVYPLPEAQLDRFLFKHRLDYPSVEQEIAIVANHGVRMGSVSIEDWGITAQADGAAIDGAIAAVAGIRLVDEVVRYIVALIRATREHAGFEAGASPRAAAMLASAARARAALDGRDYVIPDDAKALALPVLRHRVILSPTAQIEGQRVEQLVAELVERTEVPRVIYPSARAATLAAAGAIPAFVIALLFPHLWYLGLIWTLGVLALTLVDGLAGATLGEVAGAVAAPVTAMVGSPVAIRLTTRFSTLPPERVEVAVNVDPRLTGDVRRIADPGEITLDLVARKRGTARIERMWMRWRGPFGLAWKQRDVPVDQPIAITPDIGLAREEAVRLFRRDAVAGMISQLERGVGSEFHSLTDYVRGMDRRTIDWKHSARHGRLIAKEYHTEANNNIVLAIDAGRLMSEPVAGLAKLDRAVAAALLAAFVALKVGDRISLFGFDAQPRVAAGPISGAGAFSELQALAARLDYSEDETNYTLALTALAGRLDRRSLVILFTDFVDPTSAELMLRSVGQLIERHLVLFVLPRDTELEGFADAEPDDPDAVARAVTAAALLRDRRLVIARLERMGAHIIVAPYDQLGAALVNAYLDIKQRDLL